MKPEHKFEIVGYKRNVNMLGLLIPHRKERANETARLAKKYLMRAGCTRVVKVRLPKK